MEKKKIVIHLHREMIFFVLALPVLYWISASNYLFFQSLIEFFCVTVAVCIFIVTWNSKDLIDNNYLVFLGISFGFIAVIDLLQTLTFRGMGVFKGFDSNLPTQLWIAARYLQSISLLVAPIFLDHKPKVNSIIAVFSIISVLLVASIFYWKIFPVCFIEGKGLTPFKIFSEYVISLILAGSIWILYIKKKQFSTNVFSWLAISITLLIFSELAFTTYTSVFGFSNMVGHLLQFAATYLFYKAIIETALLKPYDLIFRKLNKQQEEQQIILDSVPAWIFYKDKQNRFVRVNKKFSQIMGFPVKALEGKSLWGLYPKEQADAFWKDDLEVINSEQSKVNILEQITIQDKVLWVKTDKIPFRDAQGDVIGIIGFTLDVTEMKHREDAELEQRILAESLRDTASALNSSLKLDEVLDRILDNVGRVVPLANGHIFLLDKARENAQLVRQHNPSDPNHLEPTMILQLPISKARNLREMQMTGKPIIINDTKTYDSWVVIPSLSGIRSMLGVPITIKGEVIGFLNLSNTTPNAFTQLDVDRLCAFADQAAVSIENAQLYGAIEKLAITDPLTGLFNRRGLCQLGEREIERALRFQHPLSIIMLDIDHFKRVNDTFGHQVGDRMLCALAACCLAQLREVDLVVRYGGEEFILLLPETDEASAVKVAERLRVAINKIIVSTEVNSESVEKTTKITVSLGVAMFTPDAPALTDLITQADQAMYCAKNAGRNCIKVFGHL